jgi:hypothetical protein
MRRSSWRNGWRVPRDARALTEPVTAAQVTFRALKRWELVDDAAAADLFLVQRRAAGEVQVAWDAGEALTFERVRRALSDAKGMFGETDISSATITVTDALKEFDLVDGESNPTRASRK